MVRTSIYLMAYILDDRGITPFLLLQKPRYSVSVHLKNDFSAFTFIPASVSFYIKFFRDFRRSMKSFLLINSALSIYAHKISDPLNISDILSWKILGILQIPTSTFWYTYFLHSIIISQRCFIMGNNLM